MADQKDVVKAHSDLQLQVKSKILERIHANLVSGAGVAQNTQYVKSDGTNYGMYTKSDDISLLVDIWERVFPRERVTVTSAVIGPAKEGSGR